MGADLRLYTEYRRRIERALIESGQYSYIVVLGAKELAE